MQPPRDNSTPKPHAELASPKRLPGKRPAMDGLIGRSGTDRLVGDGTL
jgi:hypothetical protein